MLYLSSFELPNPGAEEMYLNGIYRRCYNTVYPFGVFTQRTLPRLSFEPITILCGGNGCGKSTLLNVIAEKLGLARDTPGNRSSFFSDYVGMCRAELDPRGGEGFLARSRLISSDDVFDYLLNLRALNEGVDKKREELFEEYTQARHSAYRMRSMADYEELKRHVAAQRLTQSAYVRKNLMANLPERSNGESALAYFTDAIQEDALYLLDEPENSLSVPRQLELLDYIAASARFYRCQFILSTHSPFLLSLPGARPGRRPGLRAPLDADRQRARLPGLLPRARGRIRPGCVLECVSKIP